MWLRIFHVYYTAPARQRLRLSPGSCRTLKLNICLIDVKSKNTYTSPHWGLSSYQGEISPWRTGENIDLKLCNYWRWILMDFPLALDSTIWSEHNKFYVECWLAGGINIWTDQLLMRPNCLQLIGNCALLFVHDPEIDQHRMNCWGDISVHVKRFQGFEGHSKTSEKGEWFQRILVDFKQNTEIEAFSWLLRRPS